MLLQSLNWLGVLLTLGAGITGSVLLHNHYSPKTWKELLEKEGYIFLSDNNSFQGIIYDQDELIKQNIGKSTKSEELKKWCEDQTSKPYLNNNQFKSNKHKFMNLCSFSGIRTVKGRLTQSNYTNWISNDTSKQADNYKTVFSIYRHHKGFRDWLNETKIGEKINEDSEVYSNFWVLSKACDSLLNEQYTSIKDIKYFDYATWWCQPLEYKTIEERLKLLDKDWEQETDGEAILKKWQYTGKVNYWVERKHYLPTKQTPTKQQYLEWCNSILKKELKDEDAYQLQYNAIKNACRKQTNVEI